MFQDDQTNFSNLDKLGSDSQNQNNNNKKEDDITDELEEYT